MRKTFLILFAVTLCLCGEWIFTAYSEEAAPENNAQSAADYAVQPVPFPRVTLQDSFWTPRQTTNHQKSIPYAFQQCEKTGRVSNFWLAANVAPIGTQYIEPIFNDTDIYKGIEAASFDLAQNPNEEMSRYLDRLICIVGAAQEADGYLYTGISHNRDFSQTQPLSVGNRWKNLQWSHELYCAGHMYEAAAAHYIATGKRNFLDIACRNADLLVKTFGPGEGQINDVPGHEVVEMGLVKLYRITGKKEYLDLTKFFVEMRGRSDRRNSLNPNSKATYGDYAQDARPLSDENEAVGHAVRAVYFYAGAADVAALTGDKTIVESIQRIWNNVLEKKIYITGGLGGTHQGEAFADNYVLSNFNGYSETCAQIGGCGWHQRMFLLDPDAKYYDAIEQTIYNSLISGVSLSGDAFFYPNQLASRGGNRRAPWFGCACCPQNLMRFVASLGSYIYAVEKENLYVGLYIANKADVAIQGQNVHLEMTGNYPWSGDAAISVTPEKQGESFRIKLRVPGWLGESPLPGGLYQFCDGKTFRPTVKVNGETVDGTVEKGFLTISRAWKTGDKIELSFPMNPRWVRADERVKADRNRLALTRGPIVYAFEGCDNDGHIFDVFVKPEDAVQVQKYDENLLGGVVPLNVQGYLPSAETDCKPISLRAIPYCVWANREDGAMQVWMPNSVSGTARAMKPTIANRSKISASFDRGSNATMNLTSIADGEYPGGESENESWTNFDFWPHKNTNEWIQYDFSAPEEIRSIQVVWFDDSRRGGGCSVPADWKLLVQTETGEWVEPKGISGYPIESEQLQTISFDKIRAKAARLEIRLSENAAAGVYEWSVQ